MQIWNSFRGGSVYSRIIPLIMQSAHYFLLLINLFGFLTLSLFAVLSSWEQKKKKTQTELAGRSLPAYEQTCCWHMRVERLSQRAETPWIITFLLFKLIPYSTFLFFSIIFAWSSQALTPPYNLYSDSATPKHTHFCDSYLKHWCPFCCQKCERQTDTLILEIRRCTMLKKTWWTERARWDKWNKVKYKRIKVIMVKGAE